VKNKQNLLKKKKKFKKREKYDMSGSGFYLKNLVLLVECASFAGNKCCYERRGIRHDLHHDI
jgi:hypothetical protein